MQSQIDSIGYVTEIRATDIISKVGSLAMVGEIGVTKADVADFFEVSHRTIERVLETNRDEFLMYGNLFFFHNKYKKIPTFRGKGKINSRSIFYIYFFSK